MGTPTIGGDLTGTLNEGDISIGGTLDDVGFATGTTDDVFTITAQTTHGTASIDSATGQWTYTLDNSDPTVIALDPGQTLTDIFTVRMRDTSGLGSGQTDTRNVTITINGVACFVAGTLIDTPDGARPIQTLEPGDLVLTHEGEARPIRWVGGRVVTTPELEANPKLRPVRIRAGALGAGLPLRDLLVSRQHRILVRSKIAERIFGTPEVLVPAIRLVQLEGISVETAVTQVGYFHLLFDRHEVVLSEGAPSESLFAGHEALKTVGAAARQEILTLFPDLAEAGNEIETARPVPSPPGQEQLIARHLKNAKPVLANP